MRSIARNAISSTTTNVLVTALSSFCSWLDNLRELSVSEDQAKLVAVTPNHSPVAAVNSSRATSGVALALSVRGELVSERVNVPMRANPNGRQ